MTRTRRIAIDGGGTGNDWLQGRSGSFLSFNEDGYATIPLHFDLALGGNGTTVNSVTLWSAGLLSLGPPTDAQIAFMNSGQSPIPGVEGPGFPGEFFVVDYTPGDPHFFYSYGVGYADYFAPFTVEDSVAAAFFTFEDGFQIIIDINGFAIVAEDDGPTDAINGYYIGSQSTSGSGTEYQFDTYPDFFTFAGDVDAEIYIGTVYRDKFVSSGGGDTYIDDGQFFDLVTYANSPGAVNVTLGAFDQSGMGLGGFAEGDSYINILNIEGSAFNDTLTGNSGRNSLRGLGGNDTIIGGAGSDTIEGGAGADTLDGGSGSPFEIDRLIYTNSTARVVISLIDSTASGGEAEGDTIANFEGILASNFNDVLFGSNVVNEIYGNGGDDVIFGFAGNDQLFGGDGNDFLEGGAGADILGGGAGIDTLRYVGSPSGIIINLDNNTSSGGDAAGDIFSGFDIENVIGSEFADTITGSFADNRLEGGSGNDTLFGLGGNDVLIGGAGADIMDGGFENDVYFVDNAGDIVTEAFSDGGYDTVFTTVSFTLSANVERAAVDGSSTTNAVNLTGNALANELIGNAGRNVLDGGAGADLMTGYAGDDVYFVDNAGDVIIEGVGAGFDTVFAIFDYTLGDNVERVVTLDPSSTAPLRFTGNSLDNEMTGNAGANILDGGAGADLMIGGAGDDIYFVDNTGDVVSDAPGGGYDTVFTTTNFLLNSLIERVVALDNNSPTHVTLIGNEFANEITGSGGSNLIDGGLGADLLMGGAGGDAFRFSTALGGGNIDALPDFQVGTDKIYLDHAIFGALSAGSSTSAAFRAGTTAADADDRIIYDPTTGKLYYDADGNGAGAAVQFAVLHEGFNLTAGDFYVV